MGRNLNAFLRTARPRARPSMNHRPPIVVVFAASDPTAGAGLQADLLTLAALGCHGATVVTALTVQDTRGVRAMQAVDAAWVAQQAQALLADLPVAAFKLGVLATAANALAAARVLAQHPAVPVVLDPVLASGRGDTLASDEVIAAIRAELLPRTTVLTPNSLEARRLAGDAAHTDPAASAARLVREGVRYVLVTGTHEATPDVVNTLYDAGGVVRTDRWARLPGEYHGSGCTLASAVAAQIALGRPVAQAAGAAQEFTWRALEAGFRPGGGQSIPRRAYGGREPAP